jgi:hypothetical protein
VSGPYNLQTNLKDTNMDKEKAREILEKTRNDNDMVDNILDGILSDEKRDEEREAEGLSPFRPREEWYLWEFVKSGDILIDFNGHLGEGIGPVKASDTQWADDLGKHSWLHHILFKQIGNEWHKLNGCFTLDTK